MLDSYSVLLDQFSSDLDALTLESNIPWVYNPLDYARDPFDNYLEKYLLPLPKQTVLLGMNPGPWGMAQTGIPFGEIGFVKDWLKVKGVVSTPGKMHPKRPVYGFSSTRSEVSGRRVWTWAKERYGTPEAFFKDHFVLNYCPLLFFDPEGKNITPDKLLKGDREQLFALCDKALADQLRLIGAKRLVALGRFAEDRALSVSETYPLDVIRIPHPSPANPQANKGWAEQVDKLLQL